MSLWEELTTSVSYLKWRTRRKEKKKKIDTCLSSSKNQGKEPRASQSALNDRYRIVRFLWLVSLIHVTKQSKWWPSPRCRRSIGKIRIDTIEQCHVSIFTLMDMSFWLSVSAREWRVGQWERNSSTANCPLIDRGVVVESILMYLELQ